MDLRDLWRRLTGGAGAAAPPDRSAADLQTTTRPPPQTEAPAGFPLELIEVPGAEALARWEALKAEGRGAPVVLGGSLDHFAGLLEALDPHLTPEPPSEESILAAAAAMEFPAVLVELHAAEWAQPGEAPPEPEVGVWPGPAKPSAPLPLACDIVTGRPLSVVRIGLAPTQDATTLPALLRWGGWNQCPPPEVHVATLRSWRDRYGAELVGLSGDTLNLRVARRPATREEALALAREHYLYCNDTIDQGFETLSALASQLMVDDWWVFWWD